VIDPGPWPQNACNQSSNPRQGLLIFICSTNPHANSRSALTVMGFISMVTNGTREPNLWKYRMHIKCSYQHQLHKINSQKTVEGDDG